GGNRGGGCVPCIAGQQLHDRQRGRRGPRPGANLTYPTRRTTMSYAIIGFGEIGQAIAKAFAREGIEVSVATTRDPDSFAADAAAIGPTISPATLADALKADTLFLAVRFESHAEVAKALPSWEGKTLIDVTNTYGMSEEQLGGP